MAIVFSLIHDCNGAHKFDTMMYIIKETNRIFHIHINVMAKQNIIHIILLNCYKDFLAELTKC